MDFGLPRIHLLIDECCRLSSRVTQHRPACEDLDHFLKDVGNKLRCKVSFPVSKKLEQDLYGQLQIMTEKLLEARTLLLDLSKPNFCSETTTDKITQLRIVILLALSAINLFFSADEVDQELTFEDLQMASHAQIPTPSVVMGNTQGPRKSLAKFPPNWKPVHVRDKFECQVLSPPRTCRSRVQGLATMPSTTLNTSTVRRFDFPGNMQKVTDAIQHPWKPVRELGRGGYGTVWLAKDSADKYFALKELYYDPPPNACGISFERDYIEKLQELDHKHIVRYLGCEKGNGVLRIFMALAGRQSLRAYYLAQPLKIAQIKEFTRQILDALVYLHSKKIVHRDVKCDNIIVDDSDICKLVDFGVAKQLLFSGDQAKTQVGSARWMAPEILRPFCRPDGKMITGYSRPADIWSLGCTVLEMCTGDIPFPDVTNNVAVLYKIGNLKTSPDIPVSLPEQMKDFLRQCLRKDPTERPTAQMLLQHPFIAGLPELVDMWEAEHLRLQELSHSTLKEHAEAVVAQHRLQYTRCSDLTVSL